MADTGHSALLDYFRARLAGHPTTDVHVGVLGRRDVGTEPVPAATPAAAGAVAVHLTASSVVIGPVARSGPPASPCRHCLARRWQTLRSVGERSALERGNRMTSPARSPFLTPFVLQAVWQIWSAVSSGAGHRDDPGPGVGWVYSVDLQTLRVSTHALLADSGCPACGSRGPDAPDRARIDLRSRAKPGPDVFHPRRLDDYDLPVAALTNPVCGVIGASTTLDLMSTTTSPSVGSFHGGHGSWSLHEVLWTGQTDSFLDSRTAGLFEGLERFAGIERRAVTELTVDTYANVRGHALDPRAVGVYPDAVYDSEPDLTPFDPDRPMPWVWGYSLRDHRPVLVPRRMAYYGRSTVTDTFIHDCSSGCASGASVEEAVLHGLLELIERDAFLLAWYGRAALPEIDLDSCDGASRAIADRIRLCGYDVRLFDNRVDLAVPVVTAVAQRRQAGPGMLSVAAGASLDPHTAVRGALSEVASYAPTMPTRTTDRRAEIEAMASDFRLVRRLPDHQALFGLPEMLGHAAAMLAPRPLQPLAELYDGWRRRRPHTLDLLDDLRFCLDLVTGHGFDVIVVRQTAPEQRLLGLETVKVIVPGLVPIDFGWNKQRALTLPRTRSAFRRAGWRLTDLDEADLHRVPHPFP